MEDAKPKNLVSKLSAITTEMQWIKKAGRNKFHGYDFATESDIADAVRAACGKHNVWLQFSMVPETLSYDFFESKKQEPRVRTTFVGRVTIHDGDSDQKIDSIWPAFSHDSDDKGANKAMTAFAKYAMIRTFSISTGVDPDAGADGVLGEPPPIPKAKEKRLAPSPMSLLSRAIDLGLVKSKEEFRSWISENVPTCADLAPNVVPNANECIAISATLDQYVTIELPASKIRRAA